MKKRYWQAIHAHKATLVELCGFVALAVGFALLPLTGEYHLLATTTLWIAVAITWISGAQYLLDGRGAATTLGHRTART